MFTEGAPDFVVDQGMYYPAATNYGYYCTGFDSPGEWESHQMFFSVDGSNVQYAGGQSENSPYICYSPSYGFAQSPYNPYNPYIPGALIGTESSLFGSQEYYSIPAYQNIVSSPTYVPYVIQPDIMSNNSEALLEAGTANGGRSGGRGSRHKNALATAGLSRNTPKPSLSNPLNKTLEKPRPYTGQSKQPGIQQSVSSAGFPAPASTHPLQVRDAASINSQPVEDVSSSRHLSSGHLEIAPPMHNSFPATASNGYKLRPKIYTGRGVSDANRNPDAMIEQNRGPRTKRSGSQLIVKAYTSKAGNADADGNIVISSDQYNREDFRINYDDAKFFVIKSYSEDDVHKSIKYGVWSSTPHGNKKLQGAYEDAQRIAAEKSRECPVFLFFSVNASGLFCGVAEMTGTVAFDSDMDFWQQDKWSGSFPVKWHIIKDVPNSYLRHIILHNNENKPVTNSRDTQEINLKEGLEMLKIFKKEVEKTCLLDDLMYYERRERMMVEEKGRVMMYRKGVVNNSERNGDGDDDDDDDGGSVEDSASSLKMGSLAINEKETGTESKTSKTEMEMFSFVRVGSMAIKVNTGCSSNSSSSTTTTTKPSGQHQKGCSNSSSSTITKPSDQPQHQHEVLTVGTIPLHPTSSIHQ